MGQVKKKQGSLARSILAALWHDKSFSIKSIAEHPYVKLLSYDKKAGTFRSTLSRLIKAGTVKNLDGNVVLTPIGHQESLRAFIKVESALYKTNFFQKWDGAWRILFFDIPESKRKYRDFLRKALRRVGFKVIQRSIWVYPYPVPSFLGELLYHKEVKPHIRFITTDNLDNHRDMRKIFNL